MIDRDFCKLQVSRLSGLRDFRSLEVPAIRELVAALQASDSEEIAAGVVDSVLQTSEFPPSVATLKRLVWEQRLDRPMCETCRGVGWLSQDRIINGVRVGFAVPCECLPPAPIAAPRAKKPKANADVITGVMRGV